MKTKIFIMFVLLVLLQSCGSPLVVDADYPELNEAVIKDPNNAVAFYNLGLKFYTDKNFDEAINNFDLAIERDYNFSLAYFGKYCCALASDPKFKDEFFSASDEEEIAPEYLERKKDCSKNYRHAFMNDPFFDYRMATLILNRRPVAYSAEENEYIEEFYGILADGYRNYMMGRYEEAEKDLSNTISRLDEETEMISLHLNLSGTTRVVKEKINIIQPYYVRALARAQLKNYSGSLDDIDKIIAKYKKRNEEGLLPINYKNADFYYMRGHVNLRQNKLDEAKADFERCLVEDLGFYVAHSQLSNIYQKQKKYREALTEIDAAIFVEPNDPQLHYNKGVFLATIGKPVEATEAYIQSVELNKYHFKAIYNLAYTYEKLGKTEEAKKYYRMFTENAPISQQKMIDDIKQKLASWE